MATNREGLAARTRRSMIDFAQKHQRPGSGSQLRLTDWSIMERWPDLTGILNEIHWAIAGAVATRSYMPERATRDLDIVVLNSDEERARQGLMANGFIETGSLSIPGFTCRSPKGQEVDVLLVEGERWEQALEEARRHTDPNGSPVLSLPDLALMKLQSGRAQDYSDVVRMLGFADEEALERVRRIISEHAPELVDDVESMIELGKLEHQTDSKK